MHDHRLRALPALLAIALLTAAILAPSAADARPRASVAQAVPLGPVKSVLSRLRHPSAAQSVPTSPAPSSSPSSPSPSSDLSFKASRIDEFWLNQSAPGTVEEVANPTGGSAPAIAMTVDDADVYPVTPTENPRAELLSPPQIVGGSEFWASMSFFLPSDFPTSVPGWLTVLEGPYGPPFAGPPPWHIEANGNRLQWVRNGTYDWDVPWQMPLVRDSWVDVTVHERFGSDGWIEMWVNGQPITFFSSSTYNPNGIAPTSRLAMQTMDASNNGGPNAFHIMNYRQRGMFETATVLQGPLAIGKTRAAVEG